MYELYPYQITSKLQIYEAWRNGAKKVLLQTPTGAGKTIIFTHIAKDLIDRGGKTIWVLVHRKELIDQTLQKAMKYGLNFSVIQADYIYKPTVSYQIASVQTLVRRLDSIRIPPDLIITDEAHHATADSYRKIYKAFPEARHLGVTATPTRTNGQGFEDLYDVLVTGWSVKDLIAGGYLVEPKLYAMPLSFDLSQIKITAGDYNERALYNAMQEKFIVGDLVKNYVEKAPGRKMVVFAINIEHSQIIAKLYRDNGINAVHIDAKTPKSERQRIIEDFRKGHIQVLTNVEIITEGFDVPDIEAIQLVRPTKSLTLYLQMVGRGLRPAKDKENVVVLDHVNNIFAHGFPQQDRKWTLKGWLTKNGENRTKNVYVRDKTDGKLYFPYNLPETIKDFELVELDYDMTRLEYLYQLLDIAKHRGYKAGYAWYRFLEKYNIPTRYEVDIFQDISGYKKGWANYQYDTYGLWDMK